jgi:hypothetical protein
VRTGAQELKRRLESRLQESQLDEKPFKSGCSQLILSAARPLSWRRSRHFSTKTFAYYCFIQG